MTRTRKIYLLAVIVVVIAASGGCLTLDPGVSLNTTDSTVFESASPSGSWASGDIVTKVTLTSDATTSEGVTQLNVVNSKGKTFSTTTLDSGESSVTVQFPTSETATLVAVNTVNGTVVETRNATISGNTVV